MILIDKISNVPYRNHIMYRFFTGQISSPDDQTMPITVNILRDMLVNYSKNSQTKSQ